MAQWQVGGSISASVKVRFPPLPPDLPSQRQGSLYQNITRKSAGQWYPVVSVNQADPEAVRDKCEENCFLWYF